MDEIIKYKSSDIDYLIWTKKDETSKSIETLKRLLDCSWTEQKIDSIKTTKRKIEFLASRYLIKLLFGKCTWIDYRSHGSPYIKQSDWNISITHSGKYVVVARSKFRLGIDIEKISDKLDRTKHKFSSETELNNIDKNQNLFQLSLYWSAKESVYKLVGNEALIFDEEMRIEQFLPKNSGIFLLKLSSSQSRFDLTINYRKIEDYVFTYCIL